jgi:hypothetical protein
LAELGWAAGLGKKTIVCCPEGYWRKGNVDIIAVRHQMQRVETIDDLIKEVKRYVRVVGTR